MADTVDAKWPRRRGVGGRSDPLKKAIGYKKSSNLKVLDITGGFFRDAHHMAQMGCVVTALEEVDILVTAFQKLLEHDPVPGLKIVHTTAEAFLATAQVGDYDVIYFDPMFPDKRKSSLPGKESQILQKLALPKSSEQECGLLEMCRRVCKRVVVKRPIRAQSLATPRFQIQGRVVRYDVY